MKKIEKNEFFLSFRALVCTDYIHVIHICGVWRVICSTFSTLFSRFTVVNFIHCQLFIDRGSTILILPLLLCRVFVVSQPVHCMHRPMQLIHRGPHFQQYVLLQKH